MAKTFYASYIEFVPVKGETDKLLEAMIEAATSMERVRDCLQYAVGRTENGNVGVWEIWTSQDAHERSLMDKETRAFVKQTMPLIKEIIPARQIDLRGGKGTPSPAR